MVGDKKNDKLSHEDFLKNLQLEYLTHKLRSLIYRNSVYAEVSKDIADKKRLKIQELSIKFNLDSIFTPGAKVEKFISENFWKQKGLPNLQYKDEAQQRVQGNYDKWYILYRGTKVVYNGEIMEVISNNPKEETVRISGKKAKYDVNYNEISLINNFNLV